VLKLKRLVYRFEEFFFNDNINLAIEVLKLFLVIFFVAHWIACFFFAVASMQMIDTDDIWIVAKNIQDADPFDVQYLTALYWAFMTMTTVGYGDVFPYSSGEKLYTILAMIISCGVFAYIMGSIASFARRGDEKVQILEDEKQRINRFMVHNNLPRRYRTKVRHYLDYVIDYKKQFKLEEEEVLEMLSENLKYELVVHLNGKMLQDTSCFKNFDVYFLSQLTFVLQKQTFTNDDNVFDEYDYGQ
jgi:hypothetical protein